MSLKQNKIFVFFLIVILFVEISFSFLSKAQANTIIVDDPTGDDVDNGLCSIVEAVINHSTVSQDGSIDCVAGSGEGDVISIQTDIVLDTAYDIDGNSISYAIPGGNGYTINGNGHTIERDLAAPEFRIFIFSGFGNVEINDLTISGGDVDESGVGIGGAIYVSALDTLTLNNVTFDGNLAVDGGALYVSMDSSPNTVLTIDGSTFSNNIVTSDGGAIYFKNTSNTLVVDITDSSFSANSSTGGNGGAIFANNTTSLDISNSYFTENVAINSNGGVFYLDGVTSATVADSYFFYNRPSTTYGGIFYQTGNTDLIVSNSTFENTVAGSGGVFYLSGGAELTAYNSTFDTSVSIDSGGVVFSSQNVSADPNEINFYHNTERGSFSGENGSSFMYNCIFDGGACFTNGGIGNETPFVGDYIFLENNIFNTDGCEGNFQNTSFVNNLGILSSGVGCSETGANVTPTNVSTTLELKGGPWKTFALSSGSNAIDSAVSGTLGCPPTDARGVSRPFGSSCDIGAYEYTGSASISIAESGDSTDVSEPSTADTYTISLGEGPSSSVTIDLAKSENDFDVSPSSVTFTTLNWFTPKTITVTAVNNSSDDGDRSRTITHTVDTSDLSYTAIVPESVTVNITDDDEAGSVTTSSGSGPTNPPPVPGCTNSTATNYNPSATSDNGSCQYPVIDIFGCDDLNATNYDIRVTENDGSCRYRVIVPDPIVGCTDSGALNYDPSATTSNGLCVYPPVLVYGCTDALALNFNPSADTSDGSCTYNPAPEEPIIEVLPEEEQALPEENTPVVQYPENQPTREKIREVLSAVFQDTSLFLSGILGVMSEESIQAVSLAGMALPVLIFISTQPVAAASIPVRLWSLIPTLLGIKRKKRPWGTVYDSVTKQPLDPVYLVLIDENGKEVATTISDMDGRFGFIASPGRYKIKARKDDYEFPSKKLFGKERDELYGNLYFDEFIDIQNQDDLLIKNIPMDSLNFNWNEFEKSKNKNLMKFYSKGELFLSGISTFVFNLGVLFSLVLVFIKPSILNFSILGFYYVVIFLRLLGVGPKKPGHVIDSTTGNPLSFGLIKIFSSSLNKEIGHSIVGKTGRYYVLVPNGEYYVQISKKTGEDTYEHVFTSQILKIKDGYLGNIFKI